MPQIKRRIFAGATCDQIVYSISEAAERRGNRKEPRPRFENEEERVKFNYARGLRKFIRFFNANFSPSSFYSTLTFDDDYECHDFRDAKKVRDRYFNRLKYHFPEARIVIIMGRGKSTERIHFHMVTDGIPEEFLLKQWKCGKMTYIKKLRAHNSYDGVDCGCDYTSLATYLYKHWTQEQGGHRYKATRNCVQPEREAEGETSCKRTYRPDRPPRAPQGFIFVNVTYNRYGYMCFHFVKRPTLPVRGRTVSL